MTDVFEERFVVFIDILGFRSMVKAASRDPDGMIAKRVDTALEIIQDMQLLGTDEVDAQHGIDGFHSHIFSDCIVMSVAPDSFAVSKLFIRLAKLTIKLMEHGVWIRGGMSKGLISKRINTPWGPAIVEAYKVESEVAKYPRLALSKSALDFIHNHMNKKHEDGLIVRDSDDGVWSLSPITWALRSSYGHPPMLTEQLAMRIKENLDEVHKETVDNPGVFQKIDWLCDHWSKHITPKDDWPRDDWPRDDWPNHDWPTKGCRTYNKSTVNLI